MLHYVCMRPNSTSINQCVFRICSSRSRTTGDWRDESPQTPLVLCVSIYYSMRQYGYVMVCFASLRSCYRNDLFDLLRTRRYPHGCVKPLAVEAISYVSISYHVKDCIYILGTSASIFSTLRELRLVLLLYCSNHYEQDDMAWVEKLVRYKSYLYLVNMSNDCIE